MVKWLVVMGVSGCGKSVIGADLAYAMGADFCDGDDLHPVDNVSKMTAGRALTDADRAPWLAAVGGTFRGRDTPLVMACSALKRSYRDIIRDHADADLTFVHLSGAYAVIAGRMANRAGHFMPTTLLESQFATLEPLMSDEAAIIVDVDQTPEAIVAEVVAALKETQA